MPLQEMVRIIQQFGERPTHRLLYDLSGGRRGRSLEFKRQESGLEAVLDPRRVLQIPIGLLERRNGVVAPQGRLHLGEDCDRGPGPCERGGQ